MEPVPARLKVQPLWIRVERNRLKLFTFVTAFILAVAAALEAVVVLPITLAVWLMWSYATWTSLDPAGTYAFYSSVDAYWDSFGAVAIVVGVVALGVASAYVFYTLTRPLKRQLGAIGATFVPLGELLSTKNALKDMAIAGGVDPAPELFVIDSSSVNAFLIARGTHRPVCAATRGLAERLDPQEQRAVFANLIARLRAGDIQWGTVVSALMSPVWRWREAQLRDDTPMFGQPTRSFMAGDGSGATYMSTVISEPASAKAGGGIALTAFFAYVVYAFAVVVSEFVAFGHRRSHLVSAEAADAEGMLLLKDPSLMLRTLRKVIEADNRIRLAVPLYAQLFYVWAGDDLTDELDPEWRRVQRLREVVGVDGIEDAEEVWAAAQTERGTLLVPPPAPRLERDR